MSEQLELWIDAARVGGLPPLRRFILAGGAPAAASLHVARTVCRRAERSVVALGRRAVEPDVLVYLNRLSDLLFVMARAANHAAEPPNSSGEPRSRTLARAPTRTARGARARTTRTFPWRRACCRRRCVRTSPRSTPSRGPPTTMPTSPDRPAAERLRLLDAWAARVCGSDPDVREFPRETRESRGQTPSDLVPFAALGHTMRTAPAAAAVVRGPAQRLPTGRHDPPLRALGRTCSTTAGAPPTRSAASSCGLRVTMMPRLDGPSDAVCTALQLDELLAGSRARLGHRPGLRPARRSSRRRRARGGPGRGTHDAGVAARHER